MEFPSKFIENAVNEISNLPGIGKKTQQRLTERHILTIEDWENQFGPIIKPSSSTEYSEKHSHQRQISSETTFETDLLDNRQLTRILSRQAEIIGFKLRKKGLYATTIGIKIKYADFNIHTKNQRINATQSDSLIFHTATHIFKKAYTRKVGIRSLGVCVSQLKPHCNLDLFNTHHNQTLLYRAIDKNRNKYGFNCIRKASSSDKKLS